MKITTFVSIPDQEVEVHINGNDVVAAMLGDTDGWSQEQLIRRAFNNIGSFMSKMTDEEISRLGPETRRVIVKFCEEQAKRFAVNVAS